jgi:murein DD-endopeptidase MepM/ murein hydrolase activator NlpD
VIGEHRSDKRHSIDLGYRVTNLDAKRFVPVFAVQAGEVVAALDTPMGYAIAIDHGDHSWTSVYSHLSRMFVPPCLTRSHRCQHVRAGEVIGGAAKSPLHVRFELWKWIEERGIVAVDPIAHLSSINASTHEFHAKAA